MRIKSIEKVIRIDCLNLHDGTYYGTQSGHQIEIPFGDYLFRIYTENGIRGTREVKVIVISKNIIDVEENKD